MLVGSLLDAPVTTVETLAHPREETFRTWSKRPSATEEERCANAVALVRNAIDAHEALQSRRLEVFTQGSYRNGATRRNGRPYHWAVVAIVQNPCAPLEAVSPKRTRIAAL